MYEEASINGLKPEKDVKIVVPHLESTYGCWKKLGELTSQRSLSLDGHSLDIATVVALARHGCIPSIQQSDQIVKRMYDSVRTLHEYLSKGYFLYGVNTGFGGSADTRTTDLFGLQKALMQHTQSAVAIDIKESADEESMQQFATNSMPTSWTKAAMLIRCNANIRGHSAMTRSVVDAVIELLRHNITPIVPLRGSISASGDLMPLSYIAGAIQGNPDIFVRMPLPDRREKIIDAKQALEIAGIAPIVLGPKEGLSLINGTAPSAACACLALHDAQHLAVLSQLLTALTSEALAATVEWAHPFVAQVRPHKGQIEAAQNIRMFLSGSKLTSGLETSKDRFKAGLAQPRYPLRSSPQWIGPQLEDLDAAASQLTIELNSTTDNPLVDADHKDIHCAANFQATAVTSATEKTRQCVQMLGKMLFSQTSEMINHDLSNGLPPNLAADDPSLSFCLKGVDVNMAAYQSELAYLANPISTHVQSAEMHNQAVNSLAFLSARYTTQAVELLSLMSASSIYTGCQGVDLRVMHQTFLQQFKGQALEIFTAGLADTVSRDDAEGYFPTFWDALCTKWYETASLDAHERCKHASLTVAAVLANMPLRSRALSLTQVHELQAHLDAKMLASYHLHRELFFTKPTTAQYLGHGARALYKYVRGPLGVPMHRGLVEHPSPQDADGNVLDGRPKKTIGSWISTIYAAVCDGRINDEVMRYVQRSGSFETAGEEVGDDRLP